ncbi:CHAP domain-containing protein [Candidatus Saccharibacteria bacterium]|nr:CHAP domain-containing protein [Candidatus Saccharibacteria bacterium]
MQEILNIMLTTAVGLCILGASYGLDLLVGAIKVLFTKGLKWSWKKMGEDLLKMLLIAFSTEAWVVLWYVAGWYAAKVGLDITEFTNAMSISGMIGAIGIGAVWYLSNAGANLLDFINTKHIEVKVDESKVDYEAIAETVAKYTTSKAVERQKEMEEKHDKDGGLGYSYVVPIESYQVFRDTVIGNGYDLDGHYSYQCWDGACLLWQQIGRWLYTGNGCASGCWTLERDVNAGNDFDLIYDKKQIKRGDVVVFSCGQYGHIGYADEDYNGSDYIRLLGQNQSADMKFCVINMGLGTFLGAFRFKQWEKPTPTPPAPTPSKFQVGDIVVPKRLVDYYGTPLIQWDDNYVITQISGDRAVLCANRDGDLICWAAMNTKDIKKV